MTAYWFQYIWKALLGLVIVGILLAFMLAGYRYGVNKSKGRIAELSMQLSKSEETLEIQKGLYSKKVGEYNDLSVLLDTSRSEVRALKKHLEESEAKLLVAEQVSLKWKKAYEDYVKAHQTDLPPDDNGVVRKRVEFDGDLGPIHASGWTLTDPPEAHLKLEQLLPLILTMNLVQNKDGTWSTFVTSSDENVDVKIDLAGVNPLVLKERWYQRIWAEAGVSFLGDPAGRVGLRYQFDRFSVGADCTVWQTGSGCGLNVGYRIFK